jgi:hypothetical protein
MNIDWLHEPMQVAIPVAVSGVGFILSTVLWISARIEARASGKTLQTFRRCTETTIRDLGVKIEELKSMTASDGSAPASVQGLNLTTRANALRMYRRGETIPGIAAALGARPEEVELLLKVDRLLEARAA